MLIPIFEGKFQLLQNEDGIFVLELSSDDKMHVLAVQLNQSAVLARLGECIMQFLPTLTFEQASAKHNVQEKP